MHVKILVTHSLSVYIFPNYLPLTPNYLIPGSTYKKYSSVFELGPTVGGDSGAASGLLYSSFTCGEFLFDLLSFAVFLFVAVELCFYLLLEYSKIRFFEIAFALELLLEIGLLQTG